MAVKTYCHLTSDVIFDNLNSKWLNLITSLVSQVYFIIFPISFSAVRNNFILLLWPIYWWFLSFKYSVKKWLNWKSFTNRFSANLFLSTEMCLFELSNACIFDMKLVVKQRYSYLFVLYMPILKKMSTTLNKWKLFKSNVNSWCYCKKLNWLMWISSNLINWYVLSNVAHTEP